jgi:uroporphyrinogen decarboxylase
MTSKQRVACSLKWQEGDRVPIQTYLTPEIHQQLKDHFGGRNVHECLGVDFRDAWAPYRGKLRPKNGEVWYDHFGVGYKMVKHEAGGSYPEACELALAAIKTMDDFRNYPWWPSADDWDYSQIEAACDANRDFAVCIGDAGTPDILNGVSRGRGMEQVMMDIALRDEVALAIIDRRCDVLYEVTRRKLVAAKGKVDIVCLGEDMGNQNGRMFSPRDFQEIFRPRLQRFIDLAHEFGAKAMMHSCGDTHEIMPDLIEMGLDTLDAMQPEPRGMDIAAIRSLCKGKMAFCGLISTQATLPFGTEADCRAEARHRLDVVARGGGYIFAPAHCIQAGTPLKNVLAIYEEALWQKL